MKLKNRVGQMAEHVIPFTNISHHCNLKYDFQMGTECLAYAGAMFHQKSTVTKELPTTGRLEWKPYYNCDACSRHARQWD